MKTELILTLTQGHGVHKLPLLLTPSPLFMATVPGPMTLGFDFESVFAFRLIWLSLAEKTCSTGI